MADNNIKDRKPLPTDEVNNLDKVLSEKIASANECRKTLVAAIIDILTQYKHNFNIETDARNVKTVNCILDNHKDLLEKMLQDKISLDNVISALDLNVLTLLADYYVFDKSDKAAFGLNTVKTNVIACIKAALAKYAKNMPASVAEQTVIQNDIIDQNQNIDNYDVLKIYFKNIHSFVKDLHKNKIKSLKKGQKKTSSNLISKIASLNVFSKFRQSKHLNTFKTALFNKLNNVTLLKDKFKSKLLSNHTVINTVKVVNSLKNSIQKNIAKLVQSIKHIAIKDIVGNIATKLLKNLGPMIKKTKSILGSMFGSITRLIFGFISSLKLLIMPIMFAIKLLFMPIMFVLKLAFKALSLAISFIGGTIKLIFVSTFKIMSFAVKKIIGTIKLLGKGIMKVLKSNVFKKFFKFMFTTPGGMFILGFICGLIYKHIWLPFKQVIDDAGGLKKFLINNINEFAEKIENSFMSIKHKIFKKIGPKILKFLESTKGEDTLHIITRILNEAQTNFMLKYVEPINLLITQLKDLVLSEIVRFGTGAIVSAVTAIVGLCFPVASVVAGVIISAGWLIWDLFFKDSDKPTVDDINDDEVKRQHYLNLYGRVKSHKRQSQHSTLIDIYTRQNASNGDNAQQEDIKDVSKMKTKIDAERSIGLITDDEQKKLDELRKQVLEEYKLCKELNLLYYRRNGTIKNDELLLYYETKIPLLVVDVNGNYTGETTNEFVDPNMEVPIVPRTVRSYYIHKKFQEYDSGLITYDLLMDSINSLIVYNRDTKTYIYNKDIYDLMKKKFYTNPYFNNPLNSISLDDYLEMLYTDNSAVDEANKRHKYIGTWINELRKNSDIFDHIPKKLQDKFIQDFKSYLLLHYDDFKNIKDNVELYKKLAFAADELYKKLNIKTNFDKRLDDNIAKLSKIVYDEQPIALQSIPEEQSSTNEQTILQLRASQSIDDPLSTINPKYESDLQDIIDDVNEQQTKLQEQQRQTQSNAQKITKTNVSILQNLIKLRQLKNNRQTSVAQVSTNDTNPALIESNQQEEYLAKNDFSYIN